MAPAGTSSFCVCLSWLKCGRIISPKRSACIQSHGASEAPAPHVLPRSPYWKHRSRWALPKRNFLLHRCTLSLLHTSTKMKSKPRLTRWLKNSELRIATHIFLSPLVTQQHSSFWIQIICLFPLWLSNELFKMCVFCAQRNYRNKPRWKIQPKKMLMISRSFSERANEFSNILVCSTEKDAYYQNLPWCPELETLKCKGKKEILYLVLCIVAKEKRKWRKRSWMLQKPPIMTGEKGAKKCCKRNGGILERGCSCH